MRQGGMLIDLRCCLRAAVAVRDVEIEGCDSMLAEGAFERRTAIQRFGYVISHIFNRSPLTRPIIGAFRCGTLGQGVSRRSS
jgi:hypothetical protein